MHWSVLTGYASPSTALRWEKIYALREAKRRVADSEQPWPLSETSTKITSKVPQVTIEAENETLMMACDIIDLAVGAPYDGPDGQGAVYLFHGGPVRLNPQPAQVIFASEVHSGLSGFGFSLTGGSDYDENGYPGRTSHEKIDCSQLYHCCHSVFPDLIVGAYGSDQAVLLL